MPGLNLGVRASTTYVQPSNPPSASGTTATALAFGGSQVSSGSGSTAATGGIAVGIASLVLLVMIWKSLPR